MTKEELLQLPAESQALLNQATAIEEQKRASNSRSELERELAKLSESAAIAHERASKQLRELNIIIQDARQRAESLSRAGADRRGRQDDNPVHGQPNEAVDNMAAAHQTALRETESNRQRMGTFNITLFGRTMSGKSTLIEIIANGEGKSIGRGAQRTTQDVREYHWNGMKVTGVPGSPLSAGTLTRMWHTAPQIKPASSSSSSRRWRQ